MSSFILRTVLIGHSACAKDEKGIAMTRLTTWTACVAATLALTCATAPVGAWAASDCPNAAPVGTASAGKIDAKASQTAVKAGWNFFYTKHDAVQAMQSFTMAQALDPQNPDAYHGLAVAGEVIRAMEHYRHCDLSVEKTEALFKTAMGKPGARAQTQADYGRFLIYQRRSAEGLEVLQDVLAHIPDTPGLKREVAFAYYRTKNYSQACDWAERAQAAGEPVERGLVAISCKKAKAQSAAGLETARK